MKRCNNCLRKITAENPSSCVDKWGKDVCDTCTLCIHSVALINHCHKCCDENGCCDDQNGS